MSDTIVNLSNGCDRASLVNGNGNGTAASDSAPAPAPVSTAATATTASAPATSNGAAAHKAEAHAPARRAAQDAEEAAAITDVRRLVGIILNDPDLDPLREKGFNPQRLNAALANCDAADKKFDERQQAIAAQLTQTQKVNDLFQEALKRYADFREQARTVFADAASRKGLNLSQPVPDGFKEFLSNARGAYAAAQEEPYLSVLKDEGYTAEALETELEALVDLGKADGEQAQLIGDAQKATAARTKAVQPLEAFRAKVQRVGRRVFRGQPGQLAKLDC